VSIFKLQLISKLLNVIFVCRCQLNGSKLFLLHLDNFHIGPRNFAHIEVVNLVRFFSGENAQELNLDESTPREVPSH
jgi:hypothetical protein